MCIVWGSGGVCKTLGQATAVWCAKSTNTRGLQETQPDRLVGRQQSPRLYNGAGTWKERSANLFLAFKNYFFQKWNHHYEAHTGITALVMTRVLPGLELGVGHFGREAQAAVWPAAAGAEAAQLPMGAGGGGLGVECADGAAHTAPVQAQAGGGLCVHPAQGGDTAARAYRRANPAGALGVALAVNTVHIARKGGFAVPGQAVGVGVDVLDKGAVAATGIGALKAPQAHELEGQRDLACRVFAHPLGVGGAAAARQTGQALRATQAHVVAGNLATAVGRVSGVLVDLLPKKGLDQVAYATGAPCPTGLHSAAQAHLQPGLGLEGQAHATVKKPLGCWGMTMGSWAWAKKMSKFHGPNHASHGLAEGAALARCRPTLVQAGPRQ